MTLDAPILLFVIGSLIVFSAITLAYRKGSRPKSYLVTTTVGWTLIAAAFFLLLRS